MKPIEFKRYYTRSDGGSDVWITGQGDSVHICVNDDDNDTRWDDPAKLDALGDKIKEAAAALRKAKQVTFGDLKDGEYFRADGYVGRKQGCYDRFIMIEPAPENVGAFKKVQAGEGSHMREDEPVVKLRATFEEVPE